MTNPDAFIDPALIGNAEGDQKAAGGDQAAARQRRDAAIAAQREERARLRQRPGDQPLPVGNDRPVAHAEIVLDLAGRLVARQHAAYGPGTAALSGVIDDILSRLELGISRYGQPLQPGNGRDQLHDLYEELLDASAYCKTAILERAGWRTAIVEALTAAAHLCDEGCDCDEDHLVFATAATSDEPTMIEAAPDTIARIVLRAITAQPGRAPRAT